MMLKKIALLLSFTVSGCMLVPVEQEPRWTDEVLQDLPDTPAPDYIPTRRLSGAERRELAANDQEVRQAGASVREEGQPLRDQDPDSEAYAAEQRARAQDGPN